MFGFTTRRRDGWKRLSSNSRRRIRKRSGLSNRQYKKVVKANRRYKKGR